MTPHFRESELACKCGCGACKMDIKFMQAIESLRVALDFPFVVTSAYRCTDHPSEKDKVSGGGNHTKGIAIDIACTDPYKRYRILTEAAKHGITGIGVATNFIHLDSSSLRKAVWLY